MPPEPAPGRPRQPFREEPKHLLPALVAGPLLGLAVVAIYAWVEGGADAFGIGLVVAVAALVSGGFLGFLFAIPRNPAGLVPAEDRPADRYISNSNLEEISDWLTKILVGLGLVQFGRALDGGRTLVDSVAAAVGGDKGSETFGAAVLITFVVSGFLAAYIMTRVYVGPVFALSEQAMRSSMVELQEAVATVDQKIDAAIANVDEKVANVGEQVAQVHDSVATVDNRIASVDRMVANVDKKVATVDKKVANLGG